MKKKDKMADTKHPVIISTGLIDLSYGELLRCPTCEHIDTLDGFDVLGADEGCVFCTDCHQELRL